MLIEAIQSATREVFAMMLGSEVEPGPVKIGKSGPHRESTVIALLGLTGNWEGSGQICCEPELACKIASAMLMAEYDTVNDDVLDAVAEVANMVIGNVKTIVEAHAGPMGLSTPTMIFGGDFEARTAGSPDWVMTPFTTDGHEFLVQAFLAPKRASLRKRA
jgi:chemotaxis protein CheX